MNIFCDKCFQPLNTEFRSVLPGTADSGYLVFPCSHCYTDEKELGYAIGEAKDSQEHDTTMEVMKKILKQAETYCSKKHLQMVREVLESNGELEAFLYLIDKEIHS